MREQGIAIVEDKEELGVVAAQRIAERVLLNPELVLALPTGKTPFSVYRNLVALHQGRKLSFDKVSVFALDEYFELSPNHPQSCAHYMTTYFFEPVDLPRQQRHLPPRYPTNLDESCRDYEAQIDAAGGIDLAILGIGTNGHIGLNEPASPFNSKTRLVSLAKETIQLTRKGFERDEEVPKQGVTMGIKTIMHAKGILLLADGVEKAEIVKDALHGPICEALPASVLQLHPNLTVILDRAASSRLLLERLVQ